MQRLTFAEGVAKAFVIACVGAVFGAMDAALLALLTDAPSWAVFAVFLLVSQIARNRFTD